MAAQRAQRKNTYRDEGAVFFDDAVVVKNTGESRFSTAARQERPNAEQASNELDLHVVLLEPEIPQNTGNIGRICVCTDVTLHLVDPLGFKLTEKHLARAGMDYWGSIKLERHGSTEEYFAAYPQVKRMLFTGKTARNFYDHSKVHGEVHLIFGRESRGIDDAVLAAYADECVRIPMADGVRSLNLANSVSIGVYEVLRQNGFPNLH